jgi:quercetin dioxygenase-like cupin family protein
MSWCKELKKSDMAPSLLPNDRSGFRAPSRYITTHDDRGVSKFLPGHIVPSEAPWQELTPGFFHTVSWGTTTSPAQLTNDADVKAYTSGAIQPSEIVTENGTNILLLDMQPGFESALHRTASIDYGVVIHGTIESQMDSGEVRVGKPGDIFIQRGTNHLWRNPSKTEWTRMCFVVVAADPVIVGGKELEVIKPDHSSLLNNNVLNE